jgi:ubiquinone/menaquinone biosynthesis C-methylase UbiE
VVDKTKISDETAAHWEHVYKDSQLSALPWEEGAPSDQLVELVTAGLVKKGHALDICTGSGNNAIYLAQQGLSCSGIDISETAIKYAKEKSSKAGVVCDFRVGDVLNLPFADEKFDLVFDRGCFHSVAPGQRARFIEEIVRVLKPNGMYDLNCFSKKLHRWTGPPYPFSPKDIRKYFSPFFEIRLIKELNDEKGGFKDSFLSVLMEKFIVSDKKE